MSDPKPTTKLPEGWEWVPGEDYDEEEWAGRWVARSPSGYALLTIGELADGTVVVNYDVMAAHLPLELFEGFDDEDDRRGNGNG